MSSLPRFGLFLLGFLLALPLVAFEGKVHFEMKEGKASKSGQSVVYWLKGDKARMEMPGTGAGAMLMNNPDEMIVLMPEQKMYMVMPIKEAVEAAQKHTAANEVKFEDTGETETILGRLTKKYRVTDRTGTTEVWAAEGLGTFMGQLGGVAKKSSSMPRWQRELAAKGFFPLRVVGLDRKGKETSRMQVTKIEETQLADADFAVPEGYQRFDMGGMLKGLIPGMK